MTRADLEAVMPLAAKVADSVIDALDAAMRRFEIDTPPRMAAFAARPRVRTAPAVDRRT